ncbi:MAG: response regulator [Gemmatimonadaceae bacterium]
MKRVLVVDDSATMRRMIMASLASLGPMAFEEAVSGLDAIERVTVTKVDLVILDLNMPDVHGLEVLSFIRGHPSLAHLPIVILTTRGDEASRKAALDGGASLYLTKPFQPPDMARQIGQLLAAA